MKNKAYNKDLLPLYDPDSRSFLMFCMIGDSDLCVDMESEDKAEVFLHLFLLLEFCHVDVSSH